MKRFLPLVGLLAVCLIAGQAYADIATGTVRVIVSDKEGGFLKGARVTAETVDSLTKRTASTNANGQAILAALDPSAKYVINTVFTGYTGSRNESVLVRAGEVTTIRVELTLSELKESITVVEETPLVDVTSAVSGQDITLELTESLPTGRSYQSYLQLVPGVLPDDPDNPGNPASRSGLNYRDIGGDLGESRDNLYYLEGINVTDPVQGLWGANLNTEIIQEQRVLTGGLPAEYQGAAGVVSNVVTKFGGNDFSGTVNLFVQNDSLVADFDREGFTGTQPTEEFSTTDAALTIGGPIVRDKAWFFASYRNFNREDDVTALDTGEFLRTVESDSDQWYGKLTFQATNNDRFNLTFLSDPNEISGLRDRDLLNTRDRSEDRGGDRYHLKYQRVFGSGVLDLSFGEHNGELSEFSAIDASANDVIFEENQVRTLADEQLGGFGSTEIDERDIEFYRASTEWFVGSGFGQHTIKAGIEFEDHISFRDDNLINNSEFVSINNDIVAFCNNPMNDCGPSWTGTLTADFLATGTLSDTNWDVNNTSDVGGFITTLDAMAISDPANYATFVALLDSNGNSMVDTGDNLGSLITFGSTMGNPNGAINYNRDLQTASGPQTLNSEGMAVYLQDTLQTGQWTFNLGLRAERWEHFATTGENIYTFDWEYAPRVSAVYDIKGNGKQKISGYYGRYYDPVRNNMTQFAGTLTGQVTDEQVWVNDQWVTFRTRGGPIVQDAFFSPNTKTPYTDEIEFSYEVDLGRNMTFEVNAIQRKTRDILEDYDLALYALDTSGGTDYPGPTAHPDSLWLGLDYFGYDANPGSNFVIATLAGGKRDWEGIELIARKRFSNNWQGIFSYVYADAEGNSNSDSNADFQGDVLYLDPRAPGQFGNQPGTIKHLLKASGSYGWDNGFKVGGTVTWNTGTTASQTELRFRRNLPIRLPSPEEDPMTGVVINDNGNFTFAGINNLEDRDGDGVPESINVDERWLQPDSVGSLVNPSWGSLDIRAQYNRDFGRVSAEFFFDIFNLTDEQSSIRDQDLLAGTGDTAFGDPIRWVPPRRFFLGVRVAY